MPLIVAIEPDGRQAAQLTELARSSLHVKLIVVDSTERAIAEIDRCVPDLILISALLSGSDENALADRLRRLDAAAQVQTLTIPVFAGPAHARPAKGVLARLRKSRRRANAPDGCDPKVFAEQIAQYLERAAAERALVASAKAEAEAEAHVLVDETRAAELTPDESPTIVESPFVEDPVVARLVETFYVEPEAKETVLLSVPLGSVSPVIAIVSPPIEGVPPPIARVSPPDEVAPPAIEVVSPPVEGVSAPVVFVSAAIEIVPPPVEVYIQPVQEAVLVEEAPPPAEMASHPAEVVPPPAEPMQGLVEPMQGLVEAMPPAVEVLPLAAHLFLPPIELAALPPTPEPAAVRPTSEPIDLELATAIDSPVTTSDEAGIDLSGLIETTATAAAKNEDEPIWLEPLDQDTLAEFGLNLSLTADATDNLVHSEVSASPVEPAIDAFAPKPAPILNQGQEPVAAVEQTASTLETESTSALETETAVAPVTPESIAVGLAAPVDLESTTLESTTLEFLAAIAGLDAALIVALQPEPAAGLAPASESAVAAGPATPTQPPVLTLPGPPTDKMATAEPGLPPVEPLLVENAVVDEEPHPFVGATSDTESWAAMLPDWHRVWPRLDWFTEAPLAEEALPRIDLPMASVFTRPVVSKAPEPPAGARSVPASGSRKKGRKPPRPIQDEWGLFDPEQCGIAALIAKLDEFTEAGGDKTPADGKAQAPD